VAPVPAPTRQSSSVTRTTSGFPTRVAPQPTARAPMNTQAPSAAPQVRTQTAPRSSFNAPPQRSATFVAPPRTYSPPSQTVRTAPAVRAPAPASPAPRSSPSYSPPSTPRPPSAPSAPSAAPPGRGGDRSSGRSR
jgi:hypothetical protein